MQVVVTISGLDHQQERLSKLAANLYDFTAALTELGQSLILFYSDSNFISSGQALGDRWAPLAPKTEQYKDKHWPGRGILQRTGTLQHGFERTVTPDSLTISNAVPYFPYHQLGTESGPGRGHNIPARRMLGINP